MHHVKNQSRVRVIRRVGIRPTFLASPGRKYPIHKASQLVYEYSRRPPQGLENGTAGRGDIHTNAII